MLLKIEFHILCKIASFINIFILAAAAQTFSILQLYNYFFTGKEMNEKSEEQNKLIEKCLELSKGYCEYRETLLKTEAQLNYRRKELISELCCTYPIVVVSPEINPQHYLDNFVLLYRK